MTLLLLLSALIIQKPVDPLAIGAALAVGRALGPTPQAFQRIADHPHLAWYSIGYHPERDIEGWGRDTIEVEAGGRRYRAVEQFAARVGDLRVVPLSGDVDTRDLERKPMRRGLGVVVFAGFRERFAVKAVASVEKR